jgi:hypothetical protein
MDECNKDSDPSMDECNKDSDPLIGDPLIAEHTPIAASWLRTLQIQRCTAARLSVGPVLKQIFACGAF